VACLIELESPKLQPALARALGAKVLNGAACLEIPVDKDFGGQRKIAVLAERPSSPSSFQARLATTQ
jgi:hypothetical protein